MAQNKVPVRMTLELRQCQLVLECIRKYPGFATNDELLEINFYITRQAKLKASNENAKYGHNKITPEKLGFVSYQPVTDLALNAPIVMSLEENYNWVVEQMRAKLTVTDDAFEKAFQYFCDSGNNDVVISNLFTDRFMDAGKRNVQADPSIMDALIKPFGNADDTKGIVRLEDL